MEPSEDTMRMKTACQPCNIDKDNIWNRVANHPFLNGMDPHHIELLARYAIPKRFEAGQTLFSAGEPADGFYLIEKGKIALEGSVVDDGRIATDIVQAGEALGWSWLFPPYRWHFDARSIEPTTAIFFDSKILHQHYNEDLTFAHDLFKRMSEVMAHRLQATRRKLIEAVHKMPAGRMPVP
jgi:CRP/FNR family cyclic AMP-dependent transcriptional regulator